jgi:hypothetical protein
MVNDPFIPMIASKPSGACPGEELIFTSIGSQKTEGKNVKSYWDFGDGTRSAGAKLYHSYGRPGTYQVILYVDDGRKTACSRA